MPFTLINNIQHPFLQMMAYKRPDRFILPCSNQRGIPFEQEENLFSLEVLLDFMNCCNIVS